MEKVKFLKTWLMLCMLLVGMGQAWGTDVVFNFKTLQTTSGTVDGITWGTGKTGSAAATACDATNGLVLYGVSDGGGYFNTTSATSGSITKVVLNTTAKKNTPKYTAYASANGTDWTELESNISAGAKTINVSGSYKYIKIQNTTNATAQLGVSDITITYTSGGGSTPTALSTPTNLSSSNVTTTGATLSWDAVSNASNYTVKIGSTEYTNVNTNSYSATGLTAGTQYTWTVKAVGDGVNYSTSAYAANTNFTTEAEQGGDDGAVTWIASEQGYTNGTQYTSATVDENISLAFGDGGNDGKYYDTGTGIRLYANGKMTVSASNGATISKIVITYSDANYTGTFSASTGEYSLSETKGTWTGSASSVVLTNTANSGHARIQKVVVTYETSGKTTPTLSFANPTYNATMGENFTAPTLTNPQSVTVSYSSSETGVATVNANTGAISLVAAGTTTITASFAGDEDYRQASASYELVVAAAPLSTMEAIFEAATAAGSTATDCRIAFNNWVVSGVKNNNAYVTDNAGKGFIIYQSGHGFEVGDILSGTVACKVQLYNGSSELTTLTSATEGLTVTKGGVVTPVTSIALASLSGVNTGAVLSYENLEYDGTNFTDGETNLKPYNTFIALPALVSGKNYNVTGVYVQYNATKEIAPRTAEDFELNEVINNYVVTFAETLNGTITVKNGETVINEGDEVAEGTTLTITCTPTDAENYRFQNWQYKVEGGSWNTRQTNPQDYVMPSANVQFRANFESIPTYTVAFSVNGTVVQSDVLKEDAAVSVPADPEDINGKVFTGWIETSTVVGATPAYVTPSATATKTVTYYAVFATYDSEATPDQWQTTTLSALTSSDVFVMASGTNAISSANGTSGNPAAVALTVSAGAITSEVTDDIKWTLTGNATDGYIFYKNGSTNYLYINTTASSGSNTCVRVGTQNSNIRNNWKPDNNGYLKTNDSYTARYLSFYSTGSDFRGYVNTSNGAFAPTFYKLIPGGDAYSDFTTTVAAPAPVYGEVSFVATSGNNNYYATFSSNQDVIFDAEQNIEVQTVLVVDGEMMLDALNDNSLSCVTDKSKDEGWVTGYYVPANTGVLIYSIGNEPAKYYYAEDNVANHVEEVDSEYNMLRAASVAKEESGYKFYKLAYGDGALTPSTLGFYWGAAEGAAFTSREGSAYLAIPTGAGAPSHFLFENGEQTATGIENTEANDQVVKFIENGKVYILRAGVVYDVLGNVIR